MAGDIDVRTPDGVADAYLARAPGGAEPAPGVLLLMDAFGLRPRIREMADRIAAGGYHVLAPNLFYRAGRAPVLPMPDMSDEDARAAHMARVRELTGQLTPARLAADGAAYLDALGEVARGPAGIAGYCMGVRLALRIAAAHPDRVAALGGFHGGGLVTDAPDSPHTVVGPIRARLHLAHADEDRSNTPEQIAALDAALDRAGVEHRTEVYAGARHGYTMADIPAYDEAACERHFAALGDLLDGALR